MISTAKEIVQILPKIMTIKTNWPKISNLPNMNHFMTNYFVVNIFFPLREECIRIKDNRLNTKDLGKPVVESEPDPQHESSIA